MTSLSFSIEFWNSKHSGVTEAFKRDNTISLKGFSLFPPSPSDILLQSSLCENCGSNHDGSTFCRSTICGRDIGSHSLAQSHIDWSNIAVLAWAIVPQQVLLNSHRVCTCVCREKELELATNRKSNLKLAPKMLYGRCDLSKTPTMEIFDPEMEKIW